jgi:hypothetical protein
MMDNVGPFAAIKPRNLSDRFACAGEAVAATAPGKRAHRETFLPDAITMRANPGRDNDGEAGGLCSAGDGQSVGAEIPIFRD